MYASKLNKLYKYSPKNPTIESNQPLKLYGRASDCPPRGAVPPSVRPVEPYAGVVGPASLTADSIAVVRPRTSAPCMVLMTVPLRKIMKVGILIEGSVWELKKRGRAHTLARHVFEIFLAGYRR